MAQFTYSVVMPGLDPGIHVSRRWLKDVEGRDKPGHDGYLYTFASSGMTRRHTHSRRFLLAENGHRFSGQGRQHQRDHVLEAFIPGVFA